MIIIYTIILNYNSSDDAIRLYNTIPILSGCSVKTLVIDNSESGSEDQQILSENIPDESLIINNENLGYAAGNNVGIHRALTHGADYVFILNPDIKIEEDCLRILIETMEVYQKIAIIGPRICFDIDPDTIYSDGGLLYPEKGYIANHYHNRETVKENTPKIYTDIQYVNGSAMLIRASAINDIGLFNESLFLYYEETDLCMRAIEREWKIAVNTESIVYHTSSNKGSVYFYYLTRNRIWLAKLRNKYIMEAVRSVVRLLLHDTFKCLIYLKKPKKSYWPRIKGLIAGVLYSPKKT